MADGHPRILPPMSTPSAAEHFDALYEFDREPVTDDRLLGPGYFAGSLAGEHVAATEFVIGVMFVNWGASVRDMFLGLAIGNALAVLTWTLLCAPIAVQTRLTLYWYLRSIGGPWLTVVYNVLNAVLFCILAGCMITVSASAVRIPFGIAPRSTGTRTTGASCSSSSSWAPWWSAWPWPASRNSRRSRVCVRRGCS